jgi:ribosomal protein S18 acetylase RimI-like enzyme
VGADDREVRVEIVGCLYAWIARAKASGTSARTDEAEAISWLRRVRTPSRIAPVIADTFHVEWRGRIENRALDALHAEAFGHPVVDDDWGARVDTHSLGWVCGWDQNGALVGFVNVPWDGGSHAFIVDAIVRATVRRQGLGTAMIRLAMEKAREAGCEWLHVDFDEQLRAFYWNACGFTTTNAGLVNLKARSSGSA